MLMDLISVFKEYLVGANNLLSNIDWWSLLQNPWVIVLMIIISGLIFLVRGIDRVLVTFLSIPALLVLVQKTAQNIAFPDCYIDKLPVFVVSTLAIAAINVYFHLVRN
ncbi:MAG: hypothetical protein JSU72_17360 [Deltaproteobacteria bacterium]|nr:MAG: hypothetical protein JSU72_17360 [Deltaproteobacteria bacterium]